MSRNQEIEIEKKVELVRQYKAGKISQEEGARKARVKGESFRQWVKRYESEGVQGLYRGGRNRAYSDSVKLQVVEAEAAENSV